MSSFSLNGIKSTLELPCRTVRIGSLRTYPVVNKKNTTYNHEPVKISANGIKIPVHLKPDSDEKIVFKLSSKHIKSVEAYMSRGCPVLWIKPDRVWAEKIRNVCRLSCKQGPCIDPDSEASEEHEVSIIASQDPLPFAVSHSIKQIFENIAKKRGVKPGVFFNILSQKENNNKLVKCTVFIEKIEHQRHYSPIGKKSRNAEKYSSDSDFSDLSDSTEVAVSSEKGSSLMSKKSDNQALSSSICIENQKDDKHQDLTSEKKDLFMEKKPESVPNKDKESFLSEKTAPSSGNVPRKVHRARKSIPNRHRVVSIESQLRARIEEQTPKNLLSKKATENTTVSLQKRKLSDDSDTSDVSWHPSDNDTSSDLPSIKKKKTSSFLIKKKKKKSESLNRPVSPLTWSSTEIVPVVNGNSSESNSSTVAPAPTTPALAPTASALASTASALAPTASALASTTPVLAPTAPALTSPTLASTPAPPISAATEPPANNYNKSIDRKAQALSMHMNMLRKDHENMLKMTPLCTCTIKSPHSLKLSGVETAKCMAIDHIDGRLYGCFNNIRQPEMFRPSNKIPVLGLCDEHRERMLRHESCPGCGTFCVGGTFLACINNIECPHRFHRDCMILSGRHGDCPHCGGDLSNVKEITLKPGSDADLMWILAGQVPEKVRRKQYVEERGKSARMGHKPSMLLLPEKLPGISETLPNGLIIDSSTMVLQPERSKLEDMLKKVKNDIARKNRFQPKVLLQGVCENDPTKVLNLLCDGFNYKQNKAVLDTALLEAVPSKDLLIIHLLLQAGADINVRYVNGDTPLFRAFHSRSKRLMFHLLLNKADINVLDQDGMTVLHRVAMEGYIEGCHLLMTYGKANINMRCDGGYTPIMWAAEHKQATMAKYLAHYGADLTLVDNEGNICLHWAALSGDLDILLMCLQRTSNPNHVNIHGDTPLHVAARESHHDCITLLLSYGADSTIKNNEYDTPLDCTPEQNTSWMMLKVNEWIRKAGLINNKYLPLNRERILCEDLSRGYEKIPVQCVNAVDNTPCPTKTSNGFQYVTVNVHTSQDTKINYHIAALQSCSCTDDCVSSSCNCGIISEGCWYAENGTLLPNYDHDEPPLIFECNQICKCDVTCRNRVVQKGIKYRLQVYRTVGMGWGVRALETIPRGAFVCDYVGELITDAEADVREDDSYLFDLENKDGEMYCIDARNYGNVSRFINHLCEPNIIPIRVFVEHHDIRFPKLAYFATKEIKAYEELGFDYGDRFWNVKCRQFTCHCGSVNCKYSAEAFKLKAAKAAEEAEAGVVGQCNDADVSGEKP